ncbi:MAG: inositol monophosphatase family protein [Acidimicrobiales bacterium]
MSVPGPNRDPALDLALELGQAAGRMLVEGFRGVRHSVSSKSSTTDMVSEMDRAAEALIVAGLRHAYPHDSILGEEGSSTEGNSGFCWVIDPLDGTTNYLYGHPTWSVSIARQDSAGRSILGVVHHPLGGDTFWAIRGKGAWLASMTRTLDGSAINPTLATLLNPGPGPSLGHALIGTGFAYDPALRARQAEILGGVLGRVRDIRRLGSAALDLCWVAAGRLDGYWEANLAPWDKAAGELIALEAGASVEEFSSPGPHGTRPMHVTLVARPGLGPALADLVKGASSP